MYLGGGEVLLGRRAIDVLPLFFVERRGAVVCDLDVAVPVHLDDVALRLRMHQHTSADVSIREHT